MDLTEEQWALIAPLVVDKLRIKRRKVDGRGRPRFIDKLPVRIIGDKAYDSDILDQRLLHDYGIEMFAPNKSNRIVKTQDGRALRRYKRRWKIERCFAWLAQFR